MSTEFADKMKKEIASWRTRLDELKVKASLTKMEGRDLYRDAQRKFDDVNMQLNEAFDKGASSLESAREGIEAAWKRFKVTYDEAQKKYDNS